MAAIYRTPMLSWVYKLAFFVFSFIILIGIYAPLLSFSLPLAVKYKNEWYYPLFYALLSKDYFSQPIDLFFNLLMFSLPFFLVTRLLFYIQWRRWWLAISLVQLATFFFILSYPLKHPGSGMLYSQRYNKMVHEAFTQGSLPEMIKVSSWNFEVEHLSNYQQLNLLLDDMRRHINHRRIVSNLETSKTRAEIPTKYTMLDQQKFGTIKRIDQWMEDHADKIEQVKGVASSLGSQDLAFFQEYRLQMAKKKYLLSQQMWLAEEKKNIQEVIFPLHLYHWEEIESTHFSINEDLPWWNLARVNQKDLFSALIYGIRVSMTVACIAVGLACLIGIPLGACSGYFGGVFDVITCRLMEVWESMPVFFVLLFAVSILQTKSILVVITIIAFFSWPSFSRFVRAETLKQKSLPYVELSQITGFSSFHIIFNQILPNALSPLWSIIPFAMMAAISTEAALSFLGLGEEGSCSWGVLMDEGRQAFPTHAHLLWPPAIFLTILLMSIALIGDQMRDQLDPRLQS